MALPNKEHSGRVRGKGKHYNQSNTWSASQPRGFAKEVKTNFDKMQEQIIALQWYCESLQEEVYLCVWDTEHKVVVGLTQPQLGGYDSYVHGQLVGSGNA